MIYYIFKQQIFTVYLSMSNLTAITFSQKVHDYVGGVHSDFRVHELNNGKTLVYEPKKKGFEKNVIVFLKRDKFHFNLIYNEKSSNKDIVVKEARKCNNLILLKETLSWQLFECPKSLFFINKTKIPIKVNRLDVPSRKYLSKGPPVFVENKKIYYQGRLYP